MLLPRFSLRAILGIVTLSAFVFLLAGMAYRGQTWAWGVTIAVICAAITLLVHAAWFGIVWLFAQMPFAQSAAASSIAPQRTIAVAPNEAAQAAEVASLTEGESVAIRGSIAD